MSHSLSRREAAPSVAVLASGAGAFDLVCDSRFIDHPSGHLALSARNQRFQIAGLPGFIAYRRQGRHHVMSGGVHAPLALRPRLLDAFVAAAGAQGLRPLAVQLRADDVDLFASRGFTVNQLGSSFSLALDQFSLRGTARMKLRNKIKRASGAGVHIVELGRDVPRDSAAFDRLRAIDAAWLRGKGKPELDFMIGELGDPSEQQRRIFVAVDGAGDSVAYITYVPAWGSRPGVLHDLTRKRPDAPVGVMELCNAHALEAFRREGVAHLHFGFTPFIVDDQPNPGRSGAMAWIMKKLYRHGTAIYPAASQAAYKEKWGAVVVEREFIAGRPIGMRAVWDLLRLTRSI